MNQKVSIIVPIYNSEKFLKECILGLLNQTYKNTEIILINDGSHDGSEEISLDFAKRDSRIVYVKQKNEGVSKARNKGILLATGDYITFVDSDDIVLSTYIEDMVLEADNKEYIMSGYKVWNMKSNKYKEFKCPNFDGNIKEFINEIFKYISPPYLLGPCFKLFKKSILLKNNIYFPEDISFGEDAEFVINYLEHVNTIKCIENINYIYRKTGNDSLSSVFREDKIDIFFRINSDLKKLINKYSNTFDEEIKKMFLQNFIAYLQELFISDKYYKEKRLIFYKKINEYEIYKIMNNIKNTSISQKMVYISYRTKILLPTYIAFQINNIRRRNKVV